jgi:hypothetical protein
MQLLGRGGTSIDRGRVKANSEAGSETEPPGRGGASEPDIGSREQLRAKLQLKPNSLVKGGTSGPELGAVSVSTQPSPRGRSTAEQASELQAAPAGITAAVDAAEAFERLIQTPGTATRAEIEAAWGEISDEQAREARRGAMDEALKTAKDAETLL